MIINIFLSYAREDFKRVKKYFNILSKEKNFAPWMDKINIRSGKKWEREIFKAINKSQIILFFISKNSLKADKYFHKEMLEALLNKKKNENVIIIPVLLEQSNIPAQLQAYHGVELYKDNGLQKVVDDIKYYFKDDVKRQESLHTRNGTIELPCFFPSMSSTAKSTLNVIDHFELLIKINYPYYLLSAYDIYKLRKVKKDSDKIKTFIKKANEQSSIILLDSGNYEKYWLEEKFLDKKKDHFWSLDRYNSIMKTIQVDLSFHFDNLKPIEDVQEESVKIELRAIRNQKISKYATILPIIHAAKSESIPEICKLVVSRLQPLLIAVPERELGEGIFARAKTVTSIRKKLNSTGKYYPLHILGTGNPITLLILSACGADSFDGLEWCQTVVDPETGRLYHSNLADFFIGETSFNVKGLGYAASVLSHNLTFYTNWMNMIRKDIKSGNIVNTVKKYVPVDAYKKLSKALPEVFIK